MSRLFGEAASQLCGVAASLLTWRPDEFWAATPAELAMALLPPRPDSEAVDGALLAELRRQFPDD